MEFILDGYIDNFLHHCSCEIDKRTALHLKHVIPETPHLATFVSSPPTTYEPLPLSPKEKKKIIADTADAFKSIGFDTDIDTTFGGYTIPLLLKRKMNFGKRYECWICYFHFEDQPVEKEAVENINNAWEKVKQDLLTHLPEHSFLGTVIISKSAFSPQAVQIATASGIECETFQQLFSRWFSS
jgi:hypothetical protein